MKLSKSRFPKLGVDLQNTGRINAIFPPEFSNVKTKNLKKPVAVKARSVINSCLLDSGDIIVTGSREVHCLNCSGDAKWYIDKAKLQNTKILSAPTAIDLNGFILTTNNSLFHISENGNLNQLCTSEDYFDDTHLPPTIAEDGTIYLTTPSGELYSWNSTLKDLGYFGYDIVPPVLYSDETLGISGYAGSGYCRVKSDGTILWKSGLHEADTRVCIGRNDVAAVGVTNGKKTAFINGKGETLKKISGVYSFSQDYNGNWVGYSKTELCLITENYKKAWSVPVKMNNFFNRTQPLIDLNNKIIIQSDRFLLLYSNLGKLLAKMKLDSKYSTGVIPISESSFAIVTKKSFYTVS